jgi:hypothetical protein
MARFQESSECVQIARRVAEQTQNCNLDTWNLNSSRKVARQPMEEEERKNSPDKRSLAGLLKSPGMKPNQHQGQGAAFARVGTPSSNTLRP